MILKTLPMTFAVCRLEPGAAIPAWVTRGPVFSITKTSEELSVVCMQEDVPHDVKMERDWRCLKVRGLLDFSLTGILSSLASPLATAKISIFVISTFDTDYVMIKQENLSRAKETLKQAGFDVQ